MNIGGLTWEQTADALGCTTAAMAQWKTGKTGLSSKSLFRLEQLEAKNGILVEGPKTGVAEPPGEYKASEIRKEIHGVRNELADLLKRVDGILSNL